MANRFTKLVQSNYVPTFAPPDVSIYQDVAQNLQERQRRGMKQYDALQETMNQLDVLPTDQETLQRKKEQINSKLSQFADENDFIDALPAIRREARNLQKDMQQGDIATALSNKEKATETFKNIEESDWSPQMKERMKSWYLKNYRGAEKGDRLQTFAPPENIDVEGEASSAAESVERITRETIGQVPDPVSGGWKKAEIKKTGRNVKQMKRAVVNKLMSNEKAVNKLTMEARLQGKETPEEIKNYIANRASTLAGVMAQRHGGTDMTFSGVDFGDTQPAGGGTMVRQTRAPGIMQSISNIDDIEDHVAEMANAKQQGNQQKYNMMKSGLESTFAAAMREGKVTQDEYQYFMDKLESEGGKLGFGIGDILSMAESAVTATTGARPYLGGEQQDQRFVGIADKMSSFIDESGSVVGTDFPFDNPKTMDAIKDKMTTYPAKTFEIVSKELREGKSEKEREQLKKQALNEGTPKGITFTGYDKSPYYRIDFPVEEDGTEKIKTMYLREKSTPNIKEAGYKTPFEEIVNTAFGGDPVANQLLDTYKLNTIPAVGRNVYNQLPAEYKANLGENGYLSVTQQEGGGITAEVGTEDKNQTITNWDVLNTYQDNLEKSIASNRGREQVNNAFKQVEQMVRQSNTLTEVEKNTILDNVRNMTNPPKDLVQKLKEEFDSPHKFSNKVKAINFASSYRRQPDR